MNHDLLADIEGHLDTMIGFDRKKVGISFVVSSHENTKTGIVFSLDLYIDSGTTDVKKVLTNAFQSAVEAMKTYER